MLMPSCDSASMIASVTSTMVTALRRSCSSVRSRAPTTRPRLGLRRYSTQDDIASQMSQLTRMRSEEHTSELQSLMRISYIVVCSQQTFEPDYRFETIPALYFSEY